jgi:hypothetical protein
MSARAQRRVLPPANRSRSRGPDPLGGVERVIVDGSNLAYALGRDPDSGGSAAGDPRATATPRPAAGVIASVRAAFPASVRVEVVFDGTGEASIARRGAFVRAASNLFVEHAGRQSADRVIEGAVAAQLASDGPAGTWGILVVTDDRELRGLVQAKGARVAGTAWLAGRLARTLRGSSAGAPAGAGRSGTSIGHRRAPRPPRPSRADED